MVECIGSQSMHLWVLDGIAIDEKKVNCTICRAAILTLEDFIKKDVTLILSSNWCAAIWAGIGGLLKGGRSTYFSCHIYTETSIVPAQ